jgi:hypothetical protein
MEITNVGSQPSAKGRSRAPFGSIRFFRHPIPHLFKVRA